MNAKKIMGMIIGVTISAVLISGATFAWLTFGTTVTEVTNSGTTMNFVVNYVGGKNVQYLPILDSLSAKPGAGRTEATLGANQATQLVVIVGKNSKSPNGHATIWLTSEPTLPEGDSEELTKYSSLTMDGVVRWAICRDPNVEGGSNGAAFSGTVTQIDQVCGNGTDFSKALNAGIIKAGSHLPIVLLNDAMLANGKKCESALVNTLIKNGSYRNSSSDQTIFSVCPELTSQGGTSVTQTQITNGTDYMMETDGVSYFIYLWFDGKTINNEHLTEQYDKNGNIKYNLYSGYVSASANQVQN